MIDNKKDTLSQYLLLEGLLVAVILVATVMMWFYEVINPVIFHLYYVPVVLTGFFRGAYRARLMALLCILTASTLFLPDIGEVVLLEILLTFIPWAVTLVLIAMMVGSLSDDRRTAIKELCEAHEKDVLTDVLTGVANRRAFEFELSRRFADWNRDQTPLCLIVLDIDHFKKLNDRYGHQAGDAVLEAFAKVLTYTTREQNLVARYGGEEFGIVLSRMEIDQANEVAERIRNLIESSRFPHRKLLLRLTASLGVAQILPGENIKSFVQRADAAMYSSKEAGRNCVHFHDGNSCFRYGQGVATEAATKITDSTTLAKQLDIYTDETTGVPTQKVFLEEFRRRTAETHRYGGDFSIAIVSIDSLLAGREGDIRARKSLLATVARLTSSVIRETDLVARYDAVSLGILFPVTALEDVQVPLQRLRDEAAEYHDQQYPSLSYEVSIGVVQVGSDESPGAALHRVEGALASAIAAGGSVVCSDDGGELGVVVDTIEGVGDGS
ncbi:MAG: diguanylate cyclase [Planctomycetes bacterium]|nr:diguanylate cyclase [Planctomycetota bacterium]